MPDYQPPQCLFHVRCTQPLGQASDGARQLVVVRYVFQLGRRPSKPAPRTALQQHVLRSRPALGRRNFSHHRLVSQQTTQRPDPPLIRFGPCLAGQLPQGGILTLVQRPTLLTCLGREGLVVLSQPGQPVQVQQIAFYPVDQRIVKNVHARSVLTGLVLPRQRPLQVLSAESIRGKDLRRDRLTLAIGHRLRPV